MRVVASFVVIVGIAAACGGAAETNLFDEVPNAASTASGGASTSGTGSSGTASSGATSSGTGSSSGAASSSGAGSSSSGQTSSSGTSGTSGTCDPCPSSSGTLPSDAGPDIRVCNVNASSACHANEYCHTEGCAQSGVCALRPTQQPVDLTPVCGCDNVTYWNAEIAAARGANIAATGACGANAVTCTRSTGCAGGASCNLEQALICALGEPKGTCWQLPKSCAATNGPARRRCSNQQCTSLCNAIADERQFVPGTGCP